MQYKKYWTCIWHDNLYWVIIKIYYFTKIQNRHDTKIMLNSNKPKAKQSKLERLMHQQILVIFFLQVFLLRDF